MTEKKNKYLDPRPTTLKKRQLFIKVLARTGKVLESAKAVGYHDACHLYLAKKNDPEFSEAWDSALRASSEVLLDELHERAVNGVEKGVYYKGDLVATEIEKSDSLLMFSIKGRRDEYKNNTKQESTTNINVGVAMLPTTAPDEAAWEESAQITHANHTKLKIPGIDDVVEDAVVVKDKQEVTRG